MTDLPVISAPAIRALNSISIFTLEEAEQVSDEELLALHGFGRKGLSILKAAIADRDAAPTHNVQRNDAAAPTATGDHTSPDVN